MATHYIYPYVGDDLGVVITAAADSDTIILMPGSHLMTISNASPDGIVCDKNLTIEGRVDANGTLPNVEIYDSNGGTSAFYMDNAAVILNIKRVIFKFWGIYGPLVGSYVSRYLIYYRRTLGVRLDQVAIIGPSYDYMQNNVACGISAQQVGAEGILIRNCTFARLYAVMSISSNLGQHRVNDCAFQNIANVISTIGQYQELTFNTCNFDTCPTPRHVTYTGASVTENACTMEETRMWSSESMRQRIYNVNDRDWDSEGVPTLGPYKQHRAIYSSYSHSGIYYQNPFVRIIKNDNISIDASKYKHVYVGVVTVFPGGYETFSNRPFLRWSHGAGWHTSPWGWGDGYISNSNFYSQAHSGAAIAPLQVLHKDLSNNADWVGTITQITCAPFYETVENCQLHLWTAFGWILVTEEELPHDNMYEKLIQRGAGELLSTDSQLINAGSATLYDDWLAPHANEYIGELGPYHDVGVYGGLSEIPYVADPIFENLLPVTGTTLQSLPSVVVDLVSDYMDINQSTISVEAFGSIYTKSNPSDSGAVMTLTSFRTGKTIRITLTLVDSIPEDPFVVVFRGEDSQGNGATPEVAIYYIWLGKGTVTKPFLIDETVGIMAYTKPAPVLTRWEHCYDQILVEWKFDSEGSIISRGISKGEKRSFTLSGNPLIQLPNLAKHSADLLLNKFSRERKTIQQELPFAPFLDPHDIIKLLYPTKFYALNRNRKWAIIMLKLLPKVGKIRFKGLESHES